MQWILVFPGYFLWHYTLAFNNIWRVWMNLLWFVNRIFSIGLLLRTLFSPWHRMTEDDGAKFDLERWAENLVVNMMSRVVGAFVRIPIIILGLISLVVTFLFGICFYIFWVIAPVAIGALLLIGFYQLL